MQFRIGSLLVLALCTCGPEMGSDGGTSYPALQLDGKLVLGAFAVKNGAFTWSALRPPRAGTEVYAIAEIPGSTDVWLLGSSLERWNGTEVTARFEIPSDMTQVLRRRGAVDTVAVFSASDIWACGTHLMHFDGATWTNETARLGPESYLFGGCAVAGPSGGKAHVMGAAGMWIIESGAITPVPGTTFVDDTTGATLNTNTGSAFTTGFIPRTCLIALPTGEAGVLGLGVVLRSMGGKLRVRPAFGPFSAECRHGRSADSLYTMVSGNDLPFLKADLPGELVTLATLPESEQAPAGVRLGGGGSGVDVVAPVPGGALFGMGAQDLNGSFRLSAFVEVTGTTATVLADRFYGYRFYAAQQNATGLLVAVQGGGLFQGVRR